MKYSLSQIDDFMKDVERYFCNHYSTSYSEHEKKFIFFAFTQKKFVIDHNTINKVTKNPNLYKFIWGNSADKPMQYLMEHLSYIMEKHKILLKDIVLLLHDEDHPHQGLNDRICIFTDSYGRVICDRFNEARF